jgi:uncharacterized protein
MSKPTGRLTTFLAAGTALLCGYVLLTTPGLIVEQYSKAREIGPVVAWLYLGAIGVGALLILGTLTYLLVKIVAAGWRSRRRGKPVPLEQLSPAEKERRLGQDMEATRQMIDRPGVSEADRQHLLGQIEKIQQKRIAQRLEIVAFGTVSSGKSSLLNALAGREVFATDPRGGTTTARNEVSCAGLGNVVLVDTPGLGEIGGQQRIAIARRCARDADLVLFVIDGPLKDFEFQTLEALAQLGKRIILCLNKSDWYGEVEKNRLLEQIREQAERLVPETDLLAVRSSAAIRTRVRVLPDGTEQEEDVEEPADISPLAAHMLRIISGEGKDLLLANLLLRGRGLLEEAHERVRATLDASAGAVVDRYTWQTAALAAITPVPLLDAAIAGGMVTKMVSELAEVYGQSLDLEAIGKLVDKLWKNLAAIGGASAVASLLKAVPGVGTVAGGAMQGIVQAVVTQWIGRTFMTYFRGGMKMDYPSLEDEARRQWDVVTEASSLAELARQALERVGK